MNGRFQKLEFRETEVTAAAQETSSEHRAVPGLAVRTGADVLADAVDLHLREEWEPALRLYTRALGEDRLLIRAWVGQVQMLVELEEFPEALLWCGKALEIFKGDGDLLAARSLALIRDADADAALHASDTAVQAPGSSSFRWLSRGEVLMARRKPRAVDCLERGVQAAAAPWQGAAEAARICCLHGHAATAADFGRRATILHPSHPVPWLALGRAEIALGMMAQAKVSLGRSLQIDSHFPAARAAWIDAERSSIVGSFMRRVRRRFQRF